MFRTLSFFFLLATSLGLLATPVEIIPVELRGAAQPQVAVAPGGTVHVAFGQGNTVYYVASTDGGASFGKPMAIAEVPRLGLGMRRGPRITATDQVLCVSAISLEEGTLHGWISTDHGTTWTATKALNDADKSAREGLHAMAGDGQGNVFAAWLDLRSGAMELWGTRSTDGGATWSANQLLYHSPDGHICECCHPSVTLAPGGAVAIMFRNWLGGSRDMYSALSTDGGKSFSAAEKLGAGTWPLNGCPMDGGSICFAANGQLLSAWRREKTTYAATKGAPGEVGLAPESLQPLVLAAKTYHLYFWHENGALMMRKGDAATNVTKVSADATFASAALLPDGPAIAVWESAANGVKTLLAEKLP